MNLQDWRFEIQLVPAAWMYRNASSRRAIDIAQAWKQCKTPAAPVILHIDKVAKRDLRTLLPMSFGWSRRTTEIKLRMSQDARVAELSLTFDHIDCREPKAFMFAASLARVFDLSAVAPEGIILEPSADALANAANSSIPVRVAARSIRAAS
jgi:hypothetical protein